MALHSKLTFDSLPTKISESADILHISLASRSAEPNKARDRCNATNLGSLLYGLLVIGKPKALVISFDTFQSVGQLTIATGT